ncbi:hypothetical protein [Bathymodiolus japonicus methanotrophic gill symbiont]|uniref:hypothetical protein n=1 Tax=Bathymodiolus japonicus methanotrophic gill symbiont TaxID=113269 RepID=UPI001C8D00FD|nr:hypothetical protein [Bathymodiolus japonicus methanotrophic gill symbiont]
MGMKTINIKEKRIIASIIGCFLFYGLGVASAAPVKWAENGHYYEGVVIDAPSISWEEARDWASGQSYTDDSGQLYKGYLATITSAKESDFIASLPFSEVNFLLGGYQTPTTYETTAAEKEADWHWLTGEEWNYTNWRSGEPNNFFRWAGVTGAGRSEEYLQYFPSHPPSNNYAICG